MDMKREKRCSICGDITDIDEMINNMCPTCYDNEIVQCSNCGEFVMRGQLDCGLCEICYEESTGSDD